MRLSMWGLVLLASAGCAGHASGPVPPPPAPSRTTATISLVSAGSYCGVGTALAPLKAPAGAKVRWQISRGCGQDLALAVDNFVRHDFARQAEPKREEILEDVKVSDAEIVATVRRGVERCLRPACYFKYDIVATPKGGAGAPGRILLDDPEIQIEPPN